MLEERKFESFTRFSTLRFSLPDPDFWQSILECVFSLGFGRFVLEKWQLSHGFAVDGAYSLGFGTVVSEKWRLSQGSAVEKPYIPGILAHSSPNIGHCHTVLLWAEHVRLVLAR